MGIQLFQYLKTPLMVATRESVVHYFTNGFGHSMAHCYGLVSAMLKYPWSTLSRILPHRSRLATSFIQVQSIPQIPMFDMHFEGICGNHSFLMCPEHFPCIHLLFYCYWHFWWG